MKVLITGVERLDYFSQKKDKQVTGYCYHYLSKNISVKGWQSNNSLFISDEMLENVKELLGKLPEFGEKWDFDFDQKGFFQGIDFIDDSWDFYPENHVKVIK